MKLKSNFDFSLKLLELNKKIQAENSSVYFTGYHPQLGGGSFFKSEIPLPERVKAVLMQPFLPMGFLTWANKGIDEPAIVVPNEIMPLIADYLENGVDHPLNPLITDFSDLFIEVEVDGQIGRVYANEPRIVHF